jgi:hypothetical protein
VKVFLSTIILFVSFTNLTAQEFILDDRPLVEKINHTLDLIYNFEFQEAYKEIDDLERRLGNHPANHFLRSMILYWRERPFEIDTEPYINYIYELEKAIELASVFLDDEKLREEGEFYTLAGYALLTDFYNETGSRMKAIGAAKKAYSSLKEGFDLKEKFPDFYFSSGVYNYYREKYPELHPFYKTFMWLFVEGNKELGLEQLKIASEKAVFTQREALIYLFHLYLRYENNPEAALPYTEILLHRFPNNIMFKCLHVEALIYARNNNIPEGMIDSLIQDSRTLFQLAGNIFKGLIAEQSNDISKAQQYLDSAFDLYEKMDKDYAHYLGLIYTGMARVALKKKDYEVAENYYKLASKTDPYVPVREEAEKYFQLMDDG